MVTYTLLAVIAIFSIICFNDREAMSKYLFYPYGIKRYKEHYRFLTHAFIHGDIIHLLFNCLALYSFGLALEEGYFPYFFGEKLGKLYFLLLFTGGIYAASITEYLRNKDNSSYSSLGASGAISSVMFSYIILSPKSTIGLFFIPMPGWIAGVVLLGLSVFLIQRKRKGLHQDTISHESHFWGAIFGILFTIVIKPDSLTQFIKQIF